MNKLFGWIIVLVVIIGGFYYFTGDKVSTPMNSEPIKIGFIGPLTGDAAAYGEPIQNGIKLAVDEINKNGGIDGRQVEVIYEDAKCEGPRAVSSTQKLISVDKVKYIIGGMCSGESLAVVPITKEARVLQISPGSSAPKLSGSSPYFFRNNPNDNQPGAILADYVNKNYKRVGIISEKTDYAQGLKEVFIKGVDSSKVTITSEDFLTKESDFRSIVTKMKQAQVDIVFFNVQAPANAIKIAKQLKEMGLNVPTIGSVFNDKETLATGLFEGTIFAVNPNLSTDGKGGKLVSDFKARYGKNPEYAFYVGAAYDDLYLLKQAIEKVGDDSTKVKDYLQSMDSFDGTIGSYSFDENGDMIGVHPILEKVVDGKSVSFSQN